MAAHSSTRIARDAAKRIASAATPLEPERVIRVPGEAGQQLRRRYHAHRCRAPAPRPSGPGAGSPWRRTRATNALRASSPVTFCSMIAGTSASSTRPVRPTRIAW